MFYYSLYFLHLSGWYYDLPFRPSWPLYQFVSSFLCHCTWRQYILLSPFSFLLLMPCSGTLITSRAVNLFLRRRYKWVPRTNHLKIKGQMFKIEAWTVSETWNHFFFFSQAKSCFLFHNIEKTLLIGGIQKQQWRKMTVCWNSSAALRRESIKRLCKGEGAVVSQRLAYTTT